jgi:hypothetical protein
VIVVCIDRRLDAIDFRWRLSHRDEWFGAVPGFSAFPWPRPVEQSHTDKHRGDFARQASQQTIQIFSLLPRLLDLHVKSRGRKNNRARVTRLLLFTRDYLPAHLGAMEILPWSSRSSFK